MKSETKTESGVAEREALRWRQGRANRASEMLAVEEPLEIRLGGRRFTVTMRTPGHDQELVAGFLLAEGFVEKWEDISEIRRVLDSKGSPEANIVDVILRVPADELRERLQRSFVTSSSCGLCGKTTIDSTIRRIKPLRDVFRIDATVVARLDAALSTKQEIFSATGGLHAAALFDIRGSIQVVREDIGRHNAVDKVVGWALKNKSLPGSDLVLMVSGRASFEIVQKTAAAGIPVLAAVSAPSSLAVELADDAGVTLIGFVRAGDFNVYSHGERIRFPESSS